MLPAQRKSTAAHLRAAARNKRIVDWLAAHGYGADLPSRSAIARQFKAADAK